jgi:hypothetical protein
MYLETAILALSEFLPYRKISKLQKTREGEKYKSTCPDHLQLCSHPLASLPWTSAASAGIHATMIVAK